MANNANTKTNIGKMTTGIGRLSYCYIFEPAPNNNLPNSNPDQQEKYSTHLLIPKEDKKSLANIMAAIKATITDSVANYSKWSGKMPKEIKYPIHDGDDVADTKGEAYADHYYLNCSSYRKPLIIDRDKEEIEDAAEVKSGDYARLSVQFAPYSNANKGITCRPLAVQKWKDGEPLGGSVGSVDDFDDDMDDVDDDGDLPFPVAGETDEEAREAEKKLKEAKKKKKPSGVEDLMNMDFGGEDFAA